MKPIKCFFANELGVAAIEYALIFAGIVVAAVPVLTAAITAMSPVFGSSVGHLNVTVH